MSKKVITIGIITAILIFCHSITAMAIGFDAEETYDSVVAVCTETGFGSGFAIGENVIVTNAHVIARENNILVRTYSGKEYEARVLASDYRRDLALLTVDDARFTPLSLGSLDEMNAGDDVIAIGTPEDINLGWTLTKGVISNKSREFEGYPYIQIDAALNEGNSGGPLLNDSGQVVGINARKLGNSDGIGFAITVDTLLNFLSEVGLSSSNGYTADKEIRESETEPQESSITSKTNIDQKEIQYSKKSKRPLLIIIIGCVLVALVAVIIIRRKKQKEDIEIIDTNQNDFDIEL